MWYSTVLRYSQRVTKVARLLPYLHRLIATLVVTRWDYVRGTIYSPSYSPKIHIFQVARLSWSKTDRLLDREGASVQL